MKIIYDTDGKVYAKGTTKQINTIYDKIVKAYPSKKLFVGDGTGNEKCIGSDRTVTYVRRHTTR